MSASIFSHEQQIPDAATARKQNVALSELLQTLTVNSVLSSRGSVYLIDVGDASTIRDYLRLLESCRHTSIPVYQESGAASDDGEKTYVTILTPYRVLAHLFAAVKGFSARGSSNMSLLEMLETPLHKLIASDVSIEATDPPRLEASDSLLDLVRMLSAHHHVFVQRKDGSNDMVTQADLLHFFASERMRSDVAGKCSSVLRKRLRDIKAMAHSLFDDPNQPVSAAASRGACFTVGHTMSVQSALKIMYMHRVSSLAVLNEHNEWMGNIGVEQLCKLDETTAQMTTGEWCQWTREELSGDKDWIFSGEETIEDCLANNWLLQAKRLWILDNRTPTGTVSRSDLIMAFLPQPMSLDAEE
ncbi:hypothetical protein RI367_001480 [Sorochytrium milnesiophthora]